MITPYQFAINNMKAYIKSEENRRLIETMDSNRVDVFKAAQHLAIAFMKDQTDVLADLIV